MNHKIVEGINQYYTEKIKKYGNTHLGVDWNSPESQYLRFGQLSKLLQTGCPYSIIDFGCGYGELINFLNSTPGLTEFSYFGYDISESMIIEALKHFKKSENIKFGTELRESKYDYGVASGIFNVRLDLCSDDEWLDYIIQTIIRLNEITVKGFAFNALTSYSDPNYKKDYLYYSDPLILFDYCKKNFSRYVSLIHDYELYEFTIIVRK